MNQEQAPVNDGEEHTVSILSVGGKGDGIAKVKGFVIFIPETKKGDYVKIKITKVLPKLAFGQVVERLERAKRPSKFMEISKDELMENQYHSSEKYEETEDFGADLEEDD
ncbi:TRAM domain-containing protein [archaeon]|jgi:predicted RNA-binding protein with TRAM domain|nr:TRAM domain-containing protein [archaeon]MBT3451016.1 TRAM domain-containing protein [archaeon]MBT6868564.1 TRAM domain-containing protein [archaeon]MBT7193096.1 TRAM domain-containing protein [archaeon]MBT7380413.1 TRAM domain-containing protein [archaeon]